MALQFRYVLTEAGADGGFDSVDGQKIKVATYGSDAEKAREYWLDIYAQGTGDTSSKTLQSVDLSLALSGLENIKVADWQSSSGFDLFRSTSLVESTLRASQGSAGNLSAGQAVSLSADEGFVGRIKLYFDEVVTEDQGFFGQNKDLADFISVSINLDETILSSTSVGSNPNLLQSARELGFDGNMPGLEGIKVVQALGEFGDLKIQNYVGTSLETNSARVGSGSEVRPLFTNLVREGQTISQNISFTNTGDATLMRVDVESFHPSTQLAEVFSHSFFEEIGVGASSSIALSDRVNVGTAGQVLETGGFIHFYADGINQHYELDTIKNLITYQGDLNYDGKVGMRDLAFLNEGARLADINPGPVNADVDANFDGSIDLLDLAVLANDWGKTLWTGSSNSATYEGVKEVTLQELDRQNNGRQTWDNVPFTTERTAVSSGVVSALGAPQTGSDQNNYFPDLLENTIYPPIS